MFCNSYNFLDMPHLLKRRPMMRHVRGRRFDEVMSIQQEEREIINQYKEKLKNFIPLEVKTDASWGNIQSKWMEDLRRRGRGPRINPRDITRIRQELDAYVTLYQSNKLLKLYMLAEKIEKRQLGSLAPSEPLKPPRRSRGLQNTLPSPNPFDSQIIFYEDFQEMTQFSPPPPQNLWGDIGRR